jgi:hypothetical protein
MTNKTRQVETPEQRRSVIHWLLDSDPSIRWQVMRDLMDESDEIVAGERSRVATEGWGARWLDLQASDGQWGGGTWLPRCWISTSDTLLQLRDLGSNPTSASRMPSIWWSESGTVTGGGHSRTHTPGRSTSTWKMEPGSPAAGTRSVDCAFWTGIERDRNAVVTDRKMPTDRARLPDAAARQTVVGWVERCQAS